MQVKKKLGEKELAIWVNKNDGKGITAIHLASYMGNIQCIKLLIKCGADYKIKNINGMGVFHFAAQNNKYWPIVYFYLKLKKEKNDNINDSIDGNITEKTWFVRRQVNVFQQSTGEDDLVSI